jgi:hypothetical protein
MSDIEQQPGLPLDGLRQAARRASPFAGLLAAAGFAVSYLRYDLPFSLVEQTLQAPPRLLPPAVSGEQASVLQLYNYGGFNITEASAVKVAPDLVLTAGHAVVGDDGNISPACEDLAGQDKYSAAGQSDVVTSWTTTYAGSGSPGADIALLKIRRNKAFDKLPITPTTTTTAEKGETVYFVNYEEGETLDRFPNKAQLSSTIGKHEYDYPAEYAGIVIGRSESLLQVATGLQGYGPKQGREVNTYFGASGGPVENSRGQMVGLLVKTVLGSQRAQFVDDDNLVHLPVPYSARVGISFVEPITTGLVDIYKRHINAHRIC